MDEDKINHAGKAIRRLEYSVRLPDFSAKLKANNEGKINQREIYSRN